MNHKHDDRHAGTSGRSVAVVESGVFTRIKSMSQLSSVRLIWASAALLGFTLLMLGKFARQVSGGPPNTSRSSSRARPQGKIIFSTLGLPLNRLREGIHVYVMNPDSSTQTQLMRNFGVKQDFSFSRDGQSVVFAATGGKTAFASAREITNDVFIMSAGSIKRNRLYKKHYSYSPTFNSDGTKITFSAGVHEDYSNEFAIWTMNRDGTNVMRLTDTSNSNARFFTHGSWDTTPSFSPDGKQIVFSSGGGVNEYGDTAYNVPKSHWNRHIYVMGADGTQQKKLTDTPSKDYEPAFSPDGKKIVFVSERDGNAEIYVMNADGTNQNRLTRNLKYDGQPAWSPDGNMIVWVSDRTSKQHVAYSYDPRARDYNLNNEIYVMNADGTGQRRLTYNAFDERKPQWLKALPSWKKHR